MSILNRPSDGLFNILIVLVRTLVGSGPIPTDRLVSLCAPPNAVSTQERANQTLNRWKELGLLVEVDDTIRIATAYQNRLTKKNLSSQTIATVAREVALADSNNANFWEAENNRSADFTRAVSWMLAQDVYAFTPASHADVESTELAQLGNSSVFKNDTRWSGFKSWATFLGFGYTGRSPSNAFVVDPTAAVRDTLQGCDLGTRRAVADFLSMLADILPVLDGGMYRQLVEAKIDNTSWSPPHDKTVSMSMSRTFLRLRESGHLQLENNSDAESYGLLGREGRVIESVSHVVWKGGEK